MKYVILYDPGKKHLSSKILTDDHGVVQTFDDLQTAIREAVKLRHSHRKVQVATDDLTVVHETGET